MKDKTHWMIKYYSWSVFDQITVSSGNFLTIFLGAIFLSLENQGILVFLLVFYFFVLVMSISLVYAPIQNLYPGHKEKFIYIYSAFLYHLFLSLVFIICVALLILFISSISNFGVEKEVLILFLSFVLFQQIADFVRRVSYIFLTPKLSFLFSFLVYVPRIGLLIFLMPSSLHDYISFLFTATLVSSIVILMFFLRELFRSGILRFQLSSLYEHIKFSRNIVYSAPIGWLAAYYPTVLLGVVSGPVLMGVLGTFRSLIGVANVLVEVIEVSLIPKLVQEYTAGNSEFVNRVFLFLICGFVILSMFGVMIVYASFESVVSKVNVSYLEYMNVFFILIGAYVSYFFFRIYILYFRVKFITSVEIKLALLSIVTTILLTPLIYYFDIFGAAIIYLLAFLVPLILFSTYQYSIRGEL